MPSCVNKLSDDQKWPSSLEICNIKARILGNKSLFIADKLYEAFIS